MFDIGLDHHVGADGFSLTATLTNALHGFLEQLGSSRGEDDHGAMLGKQLRGGEPKA
jgi:hypothetical protein